MLFGDFKWLIYIPLLSVFDQLQLMLYSEFASGAYWCVLNSSLAEQLNLNYLMNCVSRYLIKVEELRRSLLNISQVNDHLIIVVPMFYCWLFSRV